MLENCEIFLETAFVFKEKFDADGDVNFVKVPNVLLTPFIADVAMLDAAPRSIAIYCCPRYCVNF